jgi:hypothetical protein
LRHIGGSIIPFVFIDGPINLLTHPVSPVFPHALIRSHLVSICLVEYGAGSDLLLCHRFGSSTMSCAILNLNSIEKKGGSEGKMRATLLILAVWMLAACSPKPSRRVPAAVLTPTQASTVSPARSSTLAASRTHSPAATSTPTQVSTAAPARSSTLAASRSHPPAAVTPTPESTAAPAHTSTRRPPATPARRATTLVPSPSATIDLSRQVTRTPAASPLCPPLTPGLPPDFKLPDTLYDVTNHEVIDQVLAYLNRGSSLESVSAALQSTYAGSFNHTSLIQDVNGDQAPDLVLDIPHVWVAGCRDGQYVALYDNPEAGEYEGILEVGDVNRDGVAEITFYDLIFNDWESYFRILEWDGEHFVDLIQRGREDPAWKDSTLGRFLTWYDPYQYLGAFEMGGWVNEVNYRDQDGDGMLEFYLDLNSPFSYDALILGPWRSTHEIYTWDGRKYMFSGLEIDPPRYRFQAVQDGDRLSFVGRYAEALALYQTAIFGSGMATWSRTNYREQIDSLAGETPIPTLIPYDAQEYGHLAAYARLRILLLHLVQGHTSDAQVVYDTLQARFPAGAPGHQYAQAAAAFWEQYQSSHSLAQACQVVIQAATADPAEFFRYLGNTERGEGDFGEQSHLYLPEDACPFR